MQQEVAPEGLHFWAVCKVPTALVLLCLRIAWLTGASCCGFCQWTDGWFRAEDRDITPLGDGPTATIAAGTPHSLLYQLRSRDPLVG